MVKLILVRHALTVDNQKSRLSGHIDSSISEEGKEQGYFELFERGGGFPEERKRANR